jgi:hypothetical protein
MKTIDKAIIGSTIFEGMLITLNIARESVIEWATVKADICHNNGLSFGLNRNNPSTNKM